MAALIADNVAASREGYEPFEGELSDSSDTDTSEDSDLDFNCHVTHVNTPAEIAELSDGTDALVEFADANVTSSASELAIVELNCADEINVDIAEQIVESQSTSSVCTSGACLDRQLTTLRSKLAEKKTLLHREQQRRRRAASKAVALQKRVQRLCTSQLFSGLESSPFPARTQYTQLHT